MATLEDIYNDSDFSKYPLGKSKDKTPINPDGGLNLATDETALEKARGGKLIQKKYSDIFNK